MVENIIVKCLIPDRLFNFSSTHTKFKSLVFDIINEHYVSFMNYPR